MLLLGTCTLVCSSAIVLQTIISLITVPYGYTKAEGHLFTLINCLGGVVGSIIAAFILHKHRSVFKYLTLAVIFGSLVSLAAFHIGFTNSLNTFEEFPLEIVSLFVNGLFVSTLAIYSFEYANDLAPDVPEVMSAGLLMLLTNVLSIT